MVGTAEHSGTPMSALYGYDLRKKAIAAVKRGEPKSNACQMLKLSRNTLDL